MGLLFGGGSRLQLSGRSFLWLFLLTQHLNLCQNVLGSANIALGFNAGGSVTTSNNVICIGTDSNNENDSCYIGNIFSSTVSAGAVFVNSNGRLGTMTSSKRFKQDIKPMDHVSEALYSLKPLSVRYKKEFDPAGTS
jgi:hypothetical protein